MAPTIASRVERRWRASPGVVKAFIEQRDVRAVDNAAAARAPVGASAFEGKVVGTRRERLDDEDVEILARRAVEVVPDISRLVSVRTVVKVKECVRRWRARVRSSLPTPERKTVTRMARTREDDATVTLCEETVARAMKDPAAVRCPHLLAADDDTGGFWRSDDDGARFVEPRSVRTVRVNAPGTPILAKHVQCDGCHAAMQALAVRSVAVCPTCDASVPRHVMARYAHDWDGDPATLAQTCLFCDKSNQRIAREAEERFRHGDRARAASRACIEPSCAYLAVDDVPFIETILHRNVASRWDPVARENVSTERERRARVGVYTYKSTSGETTGSEMTTTRVATLSGGVTSDDVASHEWEFERQGYAHGLRGTEPETKRGFLAIGDPPPVVDDVFPRVGQTTPTPNLMKKTYAGRRKEVRPPRIPVQ